MNLEALAAQVAGAPDDPAPLLVWADALQAVQDPLGEYIALSWAQTREQDPGRFVKARARLDELLSRHRQAWLLDAQVTEAQWRWGLLRKCAFQVDPEQLFQAQMASEDAATTHLSLLVDELARVLRAPAGRFLEAVALQLPAGLGSLAPLFERVSQHPTISGLVLTFPGGPLQVRLDALPGLRHWRLIGVPLHPATTLPASLTRLELIRTPLFPDAEALLATPLPHLTELVLGVEPLELPRLVRRWSRASHPALRRLWLDEDLADELLLALAESPLLAQLDELRVDGPFTDAGLDAVLANASRFARIGRLLLSGGAASSSLKRLAHRQLPQLELPQRRPGSAWTGW